MVFLGMVAAVMVPAYQDFTIRSQVNSGISESAIARSTVAQSYADTGSFEQSSFMEFDNTGAEFVDSVLVQNGNIIVVYGGSASDNIHGSQLVFAPYVEADSSDIVWVCGYAEPAPGLTAIGSAQETTIDPKYVPSSCK